MYLFIYFIVYSHSLFKIKHFYEKSVLDLAFLQPADYLNKQLDKVMPDVSKCIELLSQLLNIEFYHLTATAIKRKCTSKGNDQEKRKSLAWRQTQPLVQPHKSIMFKKRQQQ